MTTLEKVIAVIFSETGTDGITRDTRLDSLGLDSLEFVCLMKEIQETVADVPDAEWARMETVGEIAEACDKTLDPGYTWLIHK
jgi:acyl carrier protein